MPSFEPLERESASVATATTRPSAERSWLVPFLLVTLVLNLVMIAGTRLDLSADEAHYWDWSRLLDLAYYSKGPAVALAIRGATALFGDTAFSVRLPAALLQCGFLALFFLLAERSSDGPSARRITGLFRLTLMLSACGLAMTTDPLVCFFWTAALLGAHSALFRDRPGGWLLFGVAAGLAFLSKYTAGILLPSTAAFLLLTRAPRRMWLGFAGGVGLFALALIPVLLWNAEHGWVNVAHNAGHVTARAGSWFRPEKFLELVGGQLGLIGPVFLPAVLAAVYRVGRRGCRADLQQQFFFWQTVPLLALCVLLSFTRSVYANWPFPAFIGAALILSRDWSLSESMRARGDRLATWHWRIQVPLLLIAYALFLGFSFGLPGKYLPTKKLVGGQELGRAVDAILAESGHSVGSPNVATAATGHARGADLFLIAENYDTAALIAFYSAAHPRVMVAVVDGRRMNQYDVWGGWEELAGRDALLVLKDTASLEKLQPHFQSIAPAGNGTPPLEIRYAGETLRTFHFFFARGYDGLPPPPPSGR